MRTSNNGLFVGTEIKVRPTVKRILPWFVPPVGIPKKEFDERCAMWSKIVADYKPSEIYPGRKLKDSAALG